MNLLGLSESSKDLRLFVGDQIQLANKRQGKITSLGMQQQKQGIHVRVRIDKSQNNKSGKKSKAIWVPMSSVRTVIQREAKYQFTINDRVFIEKNNVSGYVRYVGPTHFERGIWFGIELDEPKGRNNGTVKKKFYFSSKDYCGLFVRHKRLSKPIDDIKEQHNLYNCHDNYNYNYNNIEHDDRVPVAAKGSDNYIIVHLDALSQNVGLNTGNAENYIGISKDGFNSLEFYNHEICWNWKIGDSCDNSFVNATCQIGIVRIDKEADGCPNILSGDIEGKEGKEGKDGEQDEQENEIDVNYIFDNCLFCGKMFNMGEIIEMKLNLSNDARLSVNEMEVGGNLKLLANDENIEYRMIIIGSSQESIDEYHKTDVNVRQLDQQQLPQEEQQQILDDEKQKDAVLHQNDNNKNCNKNSNDSDEYDYNGNDIEWFD